MHAIGESSPSFCHEPIQRTMERIAHEGFDVWEIMGEGDHFLPDHEKEFKRLLPSFTLKLQLHLPISDVNIGSLVAEAWERSVRTQEASLAAAARLGIERATIHPGNHTPLSQGYYGKVHEQTRRALRLLDQVALEHGVALCLENMARGWAFETDSPEKVFDLTQGTEIGHCLDVGHAFVSKRLDEFLAQAGRFGNVHVHDNKGIVDDHLTLGDGLVPWRDAVRRLVEGGFRGTFVIESQDHASGRESRARLRDALADV